MDQRKNKINVLTSGKLIRYVGVGIMTYLIDVGIILLLTQVSDLDLLIAGSVSFWISLGFNFGANKYWAFQQPAHTIPQTIKYALVTLLNFLAGLAILAIFRELNINFVYARTLTFALMPILNFWLYKEFVFRQSR